LIGAGVSLDVLEEENLLPLSEFGGCRDVIHRCLKPCTPATKFVVAAEILEGFFELFSLFKEAVWVFGRIPATCPI